MLNGKKGQARAHQQEKSGGFDDHAPIVATRDRKRRHVSIALRRYNPRTRATDAAGILVEMAGIFGVCHFDGRPAAVPAARVSFDGRLDDRDDLIGACRECRHISAASSDAELVAASYDIFGLDFARHLLGDFAVAIVDARERRVVLARDAMGIRPLYYRRTPASVACRGRTSRRCSPIPISARNRTTSYSPSCCCGGRTARADGSTLFAGVSQVPAGHVAIFTAGGAGPSLLGFRLPPARRHASFDEYAEAFRGHFQRAVKRRARSPHPVAISVSGGARYIPAIFCARPRSWRCRSSDSLTRRATAELLTRVRSSPR